MKRFFSALLCLTIIIFALSACTPRTVNEKFSVIATIFPLYDFASRITDGTDATVNMLMPPGGEVHTYEPTAKDVAAIQECSLFLYIGGESDEWVERILSSLDTPINTLRLIDFVTPLNEQHEGADSHNEHEHDEYDEHIWTSPKNAALMLDAINKKLCELDKANSETYTSNATAYGERINALDAEITAVTKTAVRKTVVFADRFPMLYFTEAYGLTHEAAFSGCSEDSEASAATVTMLIDKVKADNIPVVFYIEFSNQKLADTVCESTSAKKALFHSCHNVTQAQFDAGVSYVDLMNENLSALKEALG